MPQRGAEPGAGHSSYWNHNAAYHPWILRLARRQAGSALDVGCGEGLLLQRLSAVCPDVVGVEIDPATAERARRRLTGVDNAVVLASDFAGFDAAGRHFGLITFVASLHHLPLAATLRQAKALLAPGGDLLVVGLAARATAVDWVLSGLSIPVVRAANVLHGELRDIGVPVAPPREDLREIRAVAGAVLPGVRIRRALYYRYLLSWTAPPTI